MSQRLDQSGCAEEPIHTPGAIQPHGALLAVDRDTLLVTHASANLAAILGRPPGDVLGRHLVAALGETACRTLLATANGDTTARTTLESLLPTGHGTLLLRSYLSGRRICIDVEPARREPWQHPAYAVVESAIGGFKQATSRVELCAFAVRALRAITGYDRVLAYRFGEDGHGEVVAEDRAPNLEAYLGQHYPASDIPPQARLQYLRQPVGAIVDASYSPVPLLVAAGLDDATPLDLTNSILRSVSPLHREYMRNMGTAASLTVGLEHAHQLWGMLVCHHCTARFAGPDLRAVAGIIGQVVSLPLESLGIAEVHAHWRRRTATLKEIAGRLTSAATLIDAFAAMPTELLHLVDASGVMIRLSGSLLCLGRTPTPADAEAAFDQLYPGPGGELLAVDDVGRRHPGLARLMPALCGALLVPLGDAAGDAILWIRPEWSHTVTWGGNPDEHLSCNATTGERSPRSSFRAWQIVVSGHSAPWQEADLQLARELRTAIKEEHGRRMKATRDQFGNLFEASPTALALIGGNGDIRVVNREAARMFGYAHGALHDMPFKRLLPTRFHEGNDQQQTGFLMKSPSRTLLEASDLCGLRADGDEFPLEIGLNAIEVSATSMVLADLSDMTRVRELDRDRKSRQRELERSNADLEEFSCAVAHDLNAPMRGIRHLAEWIAEDLSQGASPSTRENLNLLLGRVTRMQKLLDGLLAYSQIGRVDRSAEDIDIADLVGEIVAMLELPRGFSVEFQGGRSMLRTERVTIQTVLENLISNAVRHHDRAQGRVTVGMTLQDGCATFRVTDDGPGIPERFQDRIFMIFQTLRRRDEFESSGIGLAIVKRKVETHGGRIWIESSAAARGSSFVFTWNESAP